MELSRLIEALSDPSAYPDAADAVEVRQTHISVVFLAGSFAYKVKKPVNLGFVDYGTSERRRHFCEEEVRLNRRLAPDVYLGVAPVVRDGDRVRLEGEGEAVEWAVKMARLPDAAALRARLERGELTAEALGELADRLAAFHASAEGGERVAASASFEVVARNARENFEQAAPQAGVTLSRAVLDRLKVRTESALARLRGVIEDRAARGVARDTHGDLRLDHVYWFPERTRPNDWVVVDCIEFADRFRHADPVADVAFLAMELTHSGRDDLAAAFSEGYLRASGDGQGGALLPFYKAYRAAVRGKVEGMKLAESEIPEAGRRAARELARSLWMVALRELEDGRGRPGVVLVGGLPGTGKSTLARDLAARAGLTVIRSDEVRKELAGRAGQDSAAAPFGEGLYTPEWDDRTYAECLRRADAIVYEGGRALVDATFREEARRRLFLDAALRWGVASCLLLCRADPGVVRARLANRRGDASDADWSVYEQAARRWEEPSPRTRAATRLIDSGQSPAEALAQAVGALRELGLVDPER
jgi:aminoglycoside phosphotransferase family enzyme/predicted kinase